jgi:hypothetical protein
MESSRDMNTVGCTGMDRNRSAMGAKVANESAICVSAPRVTFNALNRRSQWTCRAPVRDAGKANSYQSSDGHSALLLQ